jgi:hypothetical protein
LLDTLTNDLLLKLTALGLAFLLWTLVKTENQVGIDEIPVRVANQDAGWVVTGETDPPVVRVVFSGPVRELIRVAAERPSIVVPVTQVTDTSEVHMLRPGWVALRDGLNNTRVEDIRPAAVRVRFDRIGSRSVTVAATLVGAPDTGFELAGPVRLDPAMVRVTGASRLLRTLDTLRLPAIDLARRRAPDTVIVSLDSIGPGLYATPREVHVILNIRPARDSLPDDGGAR